MTTIRKSIILRAAKARVWAYLTEVDKVKTWFHPYDADLSDGREFTIIGRDSGEKIGFGKVLRADPHNLLEYSFAVGPMADDSSTVTWTLSEVPHGTQLDLVHDGLAEDAETFALVLALDKGWDEHLGQFREHVSKA